MYMKKTNKKVKTKVIIIITLVVLIASAVAVYFFLPSKNKVTSAPEIIAEPVITEEVVKVDEKWAANKKINDDYVMNVEFESGLLDLPIVQAKGELSDYEFYAFDGSYVVKNYDTQCEGGPCSLNDVYLRKDWETGKYALGGTCFLDYRNTLYDQNIIVYGHLYPRSMDPERELMFSGLDKLLKQENYEENKDVYLNLGTEKRHYQVAYVYLFNTTNDDYDNLQYYRTNYNYDYYGNEDKGYFQKYINYMEKVQPYDTGVELTEKDKTLTLQTCYDGDSNHVQITVCKELPE